MTVSFNDILSAICSQVNPVTSNDFQQIFMLADAKEAKVAADILTTHGFEAKLYADTESDASKVYVNRPTPDSTTDARLQAALSYARGLKNVKQSLDSLYKEESVGIIDYTITFANAPGNGKQIAIYMSPSPVAAAKLTPPAATTATAAASAQPVTAAKPGSRQALPPSKRKRVYAKAPQKDEFKTASALAKSYPGMSHEELQEDAHVRNLLSRFFVQNVASNSVEILMTIFGAATIITLVIMSKGLLCPDLAVSKYKQNHSWYCVAGQEEDDKKH